MSEATKAAREALGKMRPDVLTWELARSVSHSNGNFEIIKKMIGQGGRVEKLWQRGEPGEQNLSVFTVRNLQGTYTAHLEGIEKTKLGFDEKVNRFGYGEPPDSRKPCKSCSSTRSRTFDSSISGDVAGIIGSRIFAWQ